MGQRRFLPMTCARRGRSVTEEEHRDWIREIEGKESAPSDVKALRPARQAGRLPTADELELWRSETEETKFEAHRRAEVSAAPKAEKREVSASAPYAHAIGRSVRGNRMQGGSGQQVLALDRRLKRKLKSGRQTPERTIDLHGQTQDQARMNLQQFISGCAMNQLSLVLVITGKGQNDQGVLKNRVPQWLNSQPMAGSVASVYQALQVHGGTGAYYVFLKRLSVPRRP